MPIPRSVFPNDDTQEKRDTVHVPIQFYVATALGAYFASNVNAVSDEPMTGSFPPTFLSAGNTDPLWPQSRHFAQALRNADVSVTTLFFPKEQTPPVPYEYQFDLNSAAGKLALSRSEAFLAEL